MIKFDVTKAEAKTIGRIAHRAATAAKDAGVEWSYLDFDMDITATHANGCKLDLQKLEEFDDFNFNHDVFGIRRHLNRENGKLENCFLPRCARGSK